MYCYVHPHQAIGERFRKSVIGGSYCRGIMANYWIKLYIEILNDSKMATLPDRLWRRTVELFLCAGNYNDGGNLPDTSQLAWLMRMNTDELELDLQQIASTGIVQRTDRGWLVTKYAERQAAVPGKDRVQQFRNRQKLQQYYGDVTQLKRDVTQIQNRTDTDTDTEAEHAAAANIFQLYENNIGVMTKVMADKLKSAEQDYPLTWFEPAITIAVEHNARNWRYVQAILERWKTQGFPDDGKKKPKSIEEQLKEAGYTSV